MKKRTLIIAFLIAAGLYEAAAQGFANPTSTRQFTNDLYQLDEYIKRQSGEIDFTDTDSYTGRLIIIPPICPEMFTREKNYWPPTWLFGIMLLPMKWKLKNRW